MRRRMMRVCQGCRGGAGSCARFLVLIVATCLFLTGCTGMCFRIVCDPIVIDSPNATYVVIEWNGPACNIVRVTSRGDRTLVYTAGTAPTFLAIDADGNYVVTYWDHVVRKIAPNGDMQLAFLVGDFLTNLSGIAIDGNGNYIIAKADADSGLFNVTPMGSETRSFTYPGPGPLPIPFGVAIDAAGDSIVVERDPDALAKITPGGVRTEIYAFTASTVPTDVAIDGEGNYIVTESGAGNLVKITPGGTRTVLYSFASESSPVGLAIDAKGNYIVTEDGTEQLVRITPSGERTVIYTFAAGVVLWDVEVEPPPTL